MLAVEPSSIWILDVANQKPPQPSAMAVLLFNFADFGRPRLVKFLGLAATDREVQAPHNALIADDRVLEIDPGDRDPSHKERDAGPVVAGMLQKIAQTGPVIDTRCFDEGPISASGQTLALPATSTSSLPDPDDKTLAMVDISNFTTTKVVDKRPGRSGVEYKCEFGPLWLAARLVGTAQIRRVHIQAYENELV
jgi:hypothetical protein